MKRRYLLASPKMNDLAKTICKMTDYRFPNPQGPGVPNIEQIEADWSRFPDGYPNTLLGNPKQVKQIKRGHVTFLACFDKPDTIFEQISAMYALADLRPQSLKFVLPYFPTGTMERIDHEGQVATAHSLARMISAVSPAGPGPVPLYTWDIHALPIRHYFGPNIAPMFKSGVSLLRDRLRLNQQAGARLGIPTKVSVAFPDQGAYKRFKVMLEDDSGQMVFPSIVCLKRRVGTERIVTIGEGDPAGRDVVIIDDLIHSGGTIIECKNALLQAGATSVSAYATHGVMENESWKRFLNAGFSRVIITDSCPTAEAVRGTGQFEIVSLAESIFKIIMDE